jgi:hypothetical protein
MAGVNFYCNREPPGSALSITHKYTLADWYWQTRFGLKQGTFQRFLFAVNFHYGSNSEVEHRF